MTHFGIEVGSRQYNIMQNGAVFDDFDVDGDDEGSEADTAKRS